MSDLSEQQRLVIARMAPGTWHRPAELGGGDLDTAKVSRLLAQLIAAGLVERELIPQGSRRYQYRLTSAGVRLWIIASTPQRRHGVRPPRLEERLADWQRLGRELRRWLGNWLSEFLP